MPNKILGHIWLDYVLGACVLAIFALAILSGLPRLGADTSIRIATALLPPQMDEHGRGREADIIEASLSAAGVRATIEYHVLPFTRHWQVFKSDSRFQAVTTVPQEIDLDGLRSDVYIHYQNGIIYKFSSFPDGLGDAPLETLTAKRVVAFAGAASILPGVRDVSDRSSMYLERQDQRSHSILFANNQVDAVISDQLIFAHYFQQVRAADRSVQWWPAVFDPVFCPTPYRMIFRDEKIRNAFNAGLALIKSNGILAAIEARYSRAETLARVTRTVNGC